LGEAENASILNGAPRPLPTIFPLGILLTAKLLVPRTITQAI